MQSLLIICLLASLIATGMSLMCEICEGFGHTCEGPLHPCPSGFDTCGIIQTEGTVGPQIKATVKTCFPVSACEEGFAVVNLGSFGTLATKVTCCVGHECSKVPHTLPPINTHLNGKICPACYSMHSFTCKEEIAQCTGDQQYCFEIAGTSNMGFIF
ncbi:phospholipase A2 inhibitor NAI-like isoform X2 [Eublepharis macularius]|uniref:Phospholipase A2 inhibitor NAI-like isoform X2 n=1 Tax=Eublepharis macularius TaxID=481883 RepID=A0AA97KFP9_EUBMA|nr:phospholipase A2 inhibitor NAI-like isoform X2 [Eublepharis macularius]